MRGACGDLISPAGVENIRSGKHRYCLCRKKRGPLSSTCRADDAIRDPGKIFTDLAMPAVAALAGPRCIMDPGEGEAMLGQALRDRRLP